MSRKALYELSAAEVVSLTRSGTVSVEEYARELLNRIQQRDAAVHGWAYLDTDLILQSARTLDAVPPEARGPLHGVAVGIKDVMYTQDMPTCHFSPIYKDHHPQLDASCVRTLRAMGALILGKTHTTEFATSHRGPPTNNPHDASRTPGGSSSGSGAVVADFQVPIALGSQTGGSTIRPGSYNGVLSYKPTWNAVSREGVKFYSITCDTVGFFARSVADLELLADIFRLQDDVPPSIASLSGAKFGFAKTHVWPRAARGVREAWQTAKSLLTAAGAMVEEVELPVDFSDMATLHDAILHMDGKSSFLDSRLIAPHLMDPVVRQYAENKPHVSRREQLAAYDRIGRLRPMIDDIASGYTALITPSVPDEAPVMEEPTRLTGDSGFCTMWTALHVPVLNVPGFVGPHGMPIGLSVVAPRHHDRKLLQVGALVAEVFEAGGWSISRQIHK